MDNLLKQELHLYSSDEWEKLIKGKRRRICLNNNFCKAMQNNFLEHVREGPNNGFLLIQLSTAGTM